MPWNEPGSGNSGDRDPWGNGNRNKGNQSPDIDQIIDNVRRRFGGSGNGSGGNSAFPSILLIGVLLIGAWAFRSFYTVQEGYAVSYTHLTLPTICSV